MSRAEWARAEGLVLVVVDVPARPEKSLLRGSLGAIKLSAQITVYNPRFHFEKCSR